MNTMTIDEANPQTTPDVILRDDTNIHIGTEVSTMSHTRPKEINFPTPTVTMHHHNFPLSAKEVEFATIHGPTHDMVKV